VKYTYLLRKCSVGNRLSTEFYFQRVGTRFTRCIHYADSTVAVVNNVNVDVTFSITANATRDTTLSGIVCVKIDDALFTNWYCCPYSVLKTNNKCNLIAERLPTTRDMTLKCIICLLLQLVC
jgi:hypothetical protein